MQNKYPTWAAGLAGSAVIIGIAIALLKFAPQEAKAPAENGGRQTSEEMGNKNATSESGISAGGFAGTLKLSDTPAKGNLMLVTPDHIVYLRTRRDFSALLDKAVSAQIEGDLENFRLVDLTAAE